MPGRSFLAPRSVKAPNVTVVADLGVAAAVKVLAVGALDIGPANATGPAQQRRLRGRAAGRELVVLRVFL